MLKLGGREFDVIDSSTIEWDVTLLNLVQGCGLSDVTMHAGETAEGLAHRVFRSLMSSPAVFEILGCVLIPSGTNPIEWRPEMMRAQAEFIRHLSTPEDKAAINSHIRNIVAGFFLQGIVSVRTLPNVSMLLNGAGELPSDPLPPANSTPLSENGD
jgi:hypothetical protein